MSDSSGKPVFRGFNPYALMFVYRRHLPHWRQDGATYFVTFRLADSIPRPVALGWQDEDRTWLKAYGIEGDLSDPKWQAAYEALPEKTRRRFERHAGRRLHVELDKCHGSCLLRRADARETVANALKYFHGERWWVGDLVIMPNHVHGLFQPVPVGRCSAPPRDGDGPEDRPTVHELSDILGSVKGFVSTRLTKEGLKSGKLWQQENYDRLVRDREELGLWRRYIQRNPEKAGLRGREYTYCRYEWLDAET